MSSPNSLALSYSTPYVIIYSYPISLSTNIRNVSVIIVDTVTSTDHIHSIAMSVNYNIYTHVSDITSL